MFRCPSLAVAIAATAAAAPGLAASAGGQAEAVVVRPLSLVKVDDLLFGTLLPGTAAGTVVLNATTGARSTTGGVSAIGGGFQTAQFISYGLANRLVFISRGPLPTLARSGGGATMAMTAMTLNGAAIRFLTTAGALDLRIGGALAVAANQMAGTYTGTFSITVNYF